MEKNKSSVWFSVSFYSYLATVFMLPLFFLPSALASLSVSKGILLAAGVLISLFFWLVSVIAEGKVSIPKSRILLFGLITTLAAFVASIFSGASRVSFLGTGFDTASFGTLAIMFVAMFLASIFFQDKKRLTELFRVVFVSFFTLTIFQISAFFVNWPNLAAADFFGGISSGNLLGRWNDLAVFFGLMAILSLVLIDVLRAKRSLKLILCLSILASLFFLALINFLPAWIVVGFLALAVFVYSAGSAAEAGERRPFPIISFMAVLVCLVYILGNGFIGGALSSYFDFSNADVRPSVGATYEVAKGVLADNPLTGIGPNRFDASWHRFKPENVVYSNFWNISFNSGFGLIPTFFITSGIIGGLSWIIFLVYFLIRGVRQAFDAGRDQISKYLSILSFISALYLWAFAIIYNPSTAVFAFAFVMTGAFIGSTVLKKNISAIDIKFLSADARKSFFAILLIIILIILNVTAGFIYGKAFASVVYFEKANKALGKAGGLNQSQNYLIRAINLKNDALYYRALSAVNLAILGEIIQKKEITNEEKSQAEFALSQTLAAGNAAVALDMTSYQSWINLGNIYRALVPYGVKNAYENSAQSYVRASEANPRDPSIYLALANLELAHKNTEAARKYLSHAIERKFNYTEALALLSTIELEAGNLAEAINQAEKAAKSAPYDPSLLFQLGLLEYNGGFYGKAAVSLKNATLIKPDYLNAHYFLGLAYDKLDQKEMALAEFEYLAEALPENSEIAGILENLKNGLPALQKKANTGGKNSKGR